MLQPRATGIRRVSRSSAGDAGTGPRALKDLDLCRYARTVVEEWSFAGVIDAVTDAVPDREMLVWEGSRRTYREVRERTRALAAWFVDRGLGVRRERKDLARWECGQSPVAVLLSNCPEYIETMYGAFRARAVPFNVNHHYVPGEVAGLLDQIGAEAVVYHRRLAPLLAATDLDDRVLVHVDDGSGIAPLAGSTAYEDAILGAPDVALPATSPDDLYLVCTGGTTGRPKGVLWRQGDAYVAAMCGVEHATATSIGAGALREHQVWFAIPPLMHAAAQWTTFSALHLGGTVVLHDDAMSFDASAVLTTAARERVTLMTMVGDAHVHPIIEALRERVRYVVARRRGDRRRVHEPSPQGGPARASAARRGHGWLRRVGDGRDGVRRVDRTDRDRAVQGSRRRDRAVGEPLPRARARGGRAGVDGPVR